MRHRNIISTTVFAALAAASMIAASVENVSAQNVVAATCPEGYTLSGSNCIKNTPAESKTGKTGSGDQWAFITRKAFGIKTATELDGANFCAGSASADDASAFFKENNLNATHVKVDNDRAGIEKYQKYDCDVLVIAHAAADATLNNLKPKEDHLVLPEKFGSNAKVEPVAATPAPAKPKAPAAAKPQPKAKPQKTATKKRCSAVRYGYTSGNTCACAGGRVFNGSSCVRPRYRPGRRRR